MIALVDLHTFDILGLEVDAAGLLNGDDAIFTNAVHHIGDEITNLLIGGGDRGNLCNLFFALNGDSDRADIFNNCLGALVDTVFELHGVGAGGEVLQAFVDDGLSQHGRGGGAITGDIIGPGGGFFEQLRTHVLKGVLKLNFFGNGHAIMRNGGCAKFFVEGNVATLWSKRRLDGTGQNINTLFQGTTSFLVEYQLFCHCYVFLLSLSVNQPL